MCIMARHERPDDEKRPLITYINDSKFRESANRCINLLASYPLKVWETQYLPKKQTTWYVSFNGLIEKPWILNFRIQKSYTNIEFRYPQFIPDYMLDRMAWQTNNCKYLSLKQDTEELIREYLDIYLKRIERPFNEGKLKQGGRSFAEGFIVNLLEDIFKSKVVKRNFRPEWLRNKRGKCLELDIFLPELNLAIEIQGLQHFTDLYSDTSLHERLKENDLFKKKICSEKGVKLIWMDWSGINRSLMRQTLEIRRKVIDELLTDFLMSNYSFLFWRGIDKTPTFE